MERSRKKMLFALIVCLLFIGASQADTITIASLGTAADSSETNSNGTTVTIAPNSAWAAALPGSSWVSFGSTGNPSAAGYFTVANGTTVTFSDVFNIAGAPAGGTIEVMADDSASVVLNGVTLMPEASIIGDTYATCSDFGIGCKAPVTIALPAADLKTGTNTLSFLVSQRDGSSYGLDYSGSVSDMLTVPEPRLLGSLLLGLFVLAAVGLFRKNKSCQI